MQGNVTLVGRPLSSIAETRNYNKDLVAAHIGFAIPKARDMVTQAIALADKYRAKAKANFPAIPVAEQAEFSRVEKIVQRFFLFREGMDQQSAPKYADLFQYLVVAYRQISHGIIAPFEIVDVDRIKSPNSHGCVHRYGLKKPADDGFSIAVHGRIHLDFKHAMGRKSSEIARTIVHEAAHRFLSARDYDYYPFTKTFNEVQARANADSIAYFAYSNWKNGKHAGVGSANIGQMLPISNPLPLPNSAPATGNWLLQYDPNVPFDDE